MRRLLAFSAMRLSWLIIVVNALHQAILESKFGVKIPDHHALRSLSPSRIFRTERDLFRQDWHRKVAAHPSLAVSNLNWGRRHGPLGIKYNNTATNNTATAKNYDQYHFHRQPSSTIVNHASSNIVTHRQPSSSIVIHRQPSSAIVIHRQPSSPSSTIVINRRPSSTIAIHRYPSTIVIHRSSSIVIHRHYTLVARFPLPFLSPALLYLYQGGYTQRHAFSSTRRPENKNSVSA